jgi:hypothetical protein
VALGWSSHHNIGISLPQAAGNLGLLPVLRRAELPKTSMHKSPRGFNPRSLHLIKVLFGSGLGVSRTPDGAKTTCQPQTAAGVSRRARDPHKPRRCNSSARLDAVCRRSAVPAGAPASLQSPLQAARSPTYTAIPARSLQRTRRTSGEGMPQLALHATPAGPAAAHAAGVCAPRRLNAPLLPLRRPACPLTPPSSAARLLLERPFMEAICGAVGEVAQVCVLYPLETIKVKCQADGLSAAAALRAMMARGAVPGLRALYSGIGAAAVCSIIVGAVHCEWGARTVGGGRVPVGSESGVTAPGGGSKRFEKRAARPWRPHASGLAALSTACSLEKQCCFPAQLLTGCFQGLLAAVGQSWCCLCCRRSSSPLSPLRRPRRRVFLYEQARSAVGG